ncbi:hypothetical protein B0T25DRAFT_549654, partial [Lasiosphaeria hispida]
MTPATFCLVVLLFCFIAHRQSPHILSRKLGYCLFYGPACESCQVVPNPNLNLRSNSRYRSHVVDKPLFQVSFGILSRLQVI